MEKTRSNIYRNATGQYLVLECIKYDYRLRMMESNRIKGLLPLEIKETDGNKELYYDITSMEPLSLRNASTALKAEDIRAIIYGINRTIGKVGEYLLDPDDLIADKDNLFLDNDTMEPVLCCYPGGTQSFLSQMSTLLQDMLGMVDHNDQDAVVLAYSLYQESLRPGYVMKDLLKILRMDSSRKKEKLQEENKQQEKKSEDKNQQEKSLIEKNSQENYLQDEYQVRIYDDIQNVEGDVYTEYIVPGKNGGNNRLTKDTYDGMYDALNDNNDKPKRKKKYVSFGIF